MTSTAKRNIRTYLSGGVIAEGTFVKLTANGVVSQSEANQRAIGIAQSEATAAGQPVEVALPGGGAELKISEEVALGKMLTSDANGLGEVADAAGEWVGAVAYQSGVANDFIDVMVTGFPSQASDA